MRRRLGRGRGGPGLLGSVARTAVLAGTASAVVGRVGAGQEAAARREHEAAAAQEQLRAMQVQGQVDARVTEVLGTRQPPAGAARSIDDLHAQLGKLGELRQAGLLTDDEFAQQKARLLGN